MIRGSHGAAFWLRFDTPDAIDPRHEKSSWKRREWNGGTVEQEETGMEGLTVMGRGGRGKGEGRAVSSALRELGPYLFMPIDRDRPRLHFRARETTPTRRSMYTYVLRNGPLGSFTWNGFRG